MKLDVRLLAGMSHQTRQPAGFGLNVETLEVPHGIAIVLAAFTGAVHLYLYVDQGYMPFLLAGLGFYGAIGLIIMTKGLYRQLLYLAGIPYTFAQIVGYYMFEQPETFNDIGTLALVDKTVQIVLIALLAYLFYTEWEGF